MTLSFSSACILPRPAIAYKKELRVKDRDEKSVPVQELIQFRNMFFHGLPADLIHFIHSFSVMFCFADLKFMRRGNDKELSFFFSLINVIKLPVIDNMSFLQIFDNGRILLQKPGQNLHAALRAFAIASWLGQYDSIFCIADAFKEFYRNGIGNAAIQ